MNALSFLSLLEALSDGDWLTLLDGGGLRIIDDIQLKVGSAEEPDIITRGTDFNAATTDEIKQKVIENAEELLNHYYRIHPLTENGFNYQVEKLASQHGVHSFIASSGQYSAFTLFVEGGEVVAESATSPRQPYGVFMELNQKSPEEKQGEVFKKWLSSGEAYNQYLAMNVCRYNC